MLINIYYAKYMSSDRTLFNKVQLLQGTIIDFDLMREIDGDVNRKIKKVIKTSVNDSQRGSNSDRFQGKYDGFLESKKHTIYDKDSYSWLANNYIWKKGLRNWSWKVILDGIIKENIRSNLDKNKIDKLDIEHINLVWKTFLKVAGIEDLKKVPNTLDPEHADVKAVLFMYSMESFLYSRLN